MGAREPVPHDLLRDENVGHVPLITFTRSRNFPTLHHLHKTRVGFLSKTSPKRNAAGENPIRPTEKAPKGA